MQPHPLISRSPSRSAIGSPTLTGSLSIPADPAFHQRVQRYYTALTQLSRRVRRQLQRQWQRSLAGIALLMALGQAPALAATINVNASCNLIDAITAANKDTATNGCPQGNAADTINLPANSTQTLISVNDHTLDFGGASGLPIITSVITIQGNGSTITRGAGAPQFSIFAVKGGNLTLDQTTVSGGDASYAGGGVYLDFGTVTLTNCTVSKNHAGQGGGIVNFGGNLTLINSTVSGNSAFKAGGVLNGNGAGLTLTDSTVSGNSAASSGGGVYNAAGHLIINHSLIAGNTAPEAAEILTGGGTFNANNTNLFGHSGLTNAQAFSGFTPNIPPNGTDIAATSDGNKSTALSAILVPLANNGGPTQTHALCSGNGVPAGCTGASPALDAYSPDQSKSCGVDKDQRGIGRPQGAKCDIGSFELVPLLPDLVVSQTDAPDPVVVSDYLTYTITVKCELRT